MAQKFDSACVLLAWVDPAGMTMEHDGLLDLCVFRIWDQV